MGKLADLLKQQEAVKQATHQAIESRGSAGLLGNIVGDAAQIVQGIGTMAGAGLNDIYDLAYKGVANVTPLETPDPKWESVEIAKALPGALAADYKQRYGSGWGNFFEGLYEDPLAFVGDVATVATLGGYGAAKGAEAVGRTASVADDLARIAAGQTDDISRTASVVDKILPGMKYGGETPVQGTRNILNAAGRVEELRRPYNPVTRMWKEPLRKKLLERPVTDLEQNLGIYRAALEEGGLPHAVATQTKAKADQLEAILRGAKSEGVSATYKPVVSNFLLKREANKLYGSSGSSFINRRQEAFATLKKSVEKHGLTKEQQGNLHSSLQWDTPSGSRLSIDEIREAFLDPGAEPVVQSLREVVSGDMERWQALRQEAQNISDPARRLELETEADAARRYIEHMSEPVAAQRAGVVDPVADTMDDLRSWVHKNMTEPAIELGLLDYKTIMDHTYLPGKIKQYGAKWLDELDGLDSPVSTSEIDDIIRAQGKKAPIYFPHIDARRLAQQGGFKSFLMAWRSRGMRSASKMPGLKRSKGYLLSHDLYLTDPLEAYARRASEAIKYSETQRLLNKVTEKFARPIRTMDDFDPETEALWSPDITKAQYKNALRLQEEINDYLESTADLGEAAEKGLSAALPRIEDEAVEALTNKGQMYAVPKVVAEQLERFARPNVGGAPLRVFHDGPVNLWRSAVLAGSPRWLTNNVLGNTMFLKLQGGKLSDVLRQAVSPSFRKRLSDVAPEGVESGFFSSAEQYQTQLGSAGRTVAGQRLTAATEALKGTKVAKAGRTYTDFVQRMNSSIEDAYRRASYIRAGERELAVRNIKKSGKSFWTSKRTLENIAKKGTDEKFVARALGEVNDYLNNYGALSPFERKVVRRFIAPFWSFYKHVAKMTVTLPVKHPVKTNVLRGLGLAAQDFIDDEYGYLPEWVRGNMPIGPGQDPGETRFLSTRGANPLSGVFENPMSMLNPLAQMGLEQTTGRDTFTGREFTSGDVVTPYGSDQGYRYDPETGQMMPVERRLGGILAGVAPSLMESLISSIPQAELLRSLVDPGARYTATGEVMIDPSTGQPRYPTDPLQELMKFFGASTFDVNLEEAKARMSEEQIAAMRAYLNRGP